MSFFRAAACVGAVLAASLSAASAEPPAGNYEFRSVAQKDGAPVCVEHWDFGGDGVLTVRSGEEIVHAHFTLVHDAAGDWIVTTNIDTNGRSDCMGQSRTTLPEGESRIYWFATNDGTINLCPPPAREPVYVSGCFAYLRQPASKGNRPGR